MDWPSWAPIATHLVVFAAGVWSGRALVVRRLKVVDYHGHPAVTVRDPDDTD